MSRPLLWLVGGLGVLGALLLVVALAVVLLLDPIRVRDQLVSMVREQTGRELRVAQPVELAFFPWLGVTLHEVALDNAPGFGDGPLASAAEVRVRVRVLPLLSGNLELDSLVLRGLVLQLVRNAGGEVNWTGPRRLVPAAPDDPARQAAPARKGLEAFLIGGIDLGGACLVLRDQRAGTTYVLDDLKLQTGAIAAGLNIPVHVETRLRAEGMSGELTLAGHGRVRFDERLTTLNVPDLSLQINGEGAGLRLTGEVRGSRVVDEPAFEGLLEIAEAKPRALLGPLGIADFATSDPTVLGRLTAKLPFEASSRGVTIEGLSLTLDETVVTGRFAVADRAIGALRFDLAADRLDLDRYLPPPAQARPTIAPTGAPPSQPKAAGAVVAAGAGLPAEVLRRLDADGTLRIGALEVGGARLAEVRTHWRAQGGVITQTAEARLYGGSGRSASTLDVRQSPSVMTLKGALEGVDLRGLLADTTGQSRLSGNGNIDADLRWNGLTEQEIRRSLTGSARLSLRDGVLQGFDLDALVRNALAAAQGGRTAGGANQTALSELTASLTADNGVLSNRDLRATSALLSVAGAGTIDLPANRIDYLAQATLLPSAQGLLGARLAELRGTPIPVRFSGSLDAPSITLDVEEVLRGGAGQLIQRKIEDKLKGGWGDKLKRFLDR